MAMKKVESVYDIIRKTIEVSDLKSGQLVVSFYTTGVRGAKPIVIPYSEYNDFADTLSRYSIQGVERELGHMSSSDILDNSITSDSNNISFRVRERYQDGAVQIPKALFGIVSELLVSLKDSIRLAAEMIISEAAKEAESSENDTTVIDTDDESVAD